jgi:hypothetical protein
MIRAARTEIQTRARSRGRNSVTANGAIVIIATSSNPALDPKIAASNSANSQLAVSSHLPQALHAIGATTEKEAAMISEPSPELVR